VLVQGYFITVSGLKSSIFSGDWCARLYGNIGNEITTDDKRKYEVTFDDLPNRTFLLGAGSLRYEGERRKTRARVEENLVASTNNNNDQEDPDLLEDAVQDSNEPSATALRMMLNFF
jgi:hypothetical protein